MPCFAKPNLKAKKTAANEPVSYLKQERDLLGRLSGCFVVLSHHREKEAIENLELVSYPRSLFQGDSLCPCIDESEIARQLQSWARTPSIGFQTPSAEVTNKQMMTGAPVLSPHHLSLRKLGWVKIAGNI